MTDLALVGSPLLGPAVWRSTAPALVRAGRRATVVPVLPAAPQGPEDVVEHVAGYLAGRGDVVLVVHSNAALFVPVLGSRLPVVAAVLVDAALPPARGSAPLAPPDMLPVLREKAGDNGLLPPWTAWWAEEDVGPLFPDAATRAAVEAEQHRLPLRYFSAELGVPEGWTDRPAGYLRLSEAYARQAEQAAAWGWPTATSPGHHLQPLVDPEGVAAAIVHLLDRLGVRAERGRPGP